LKGNIGSVIGFLKQRMQQYAEKLEYEQAQQLKEKIDTLESYRAKSTIVSPSIHEVDVCTLINEPESAFVNYLSIHNGAIIHAYTAEVKKKLNESSDEVLSYVIPELRERFESQSKEILLVEPVGFALEGIKFSVPQRGDKKELIDLSLRNAKFYKLEKQKQEKIIDPEKHTNRILGQIKTDFRLKEIPRHIECFDNSNIQGTNAVSACVVFRNGKPSKKDYRHFNVKTVEGPDDFATMEEVVYRRYKRLLDEQQGLPQLIVIDGGKGQLSAAMESIKKLNLEGKTTLVGLAKNEEELFFYGDQQSIKLPWGSESLKLIRRIRDEVHRYGITFHRNLRSKGSITNELEQIEGVGRATIEVLLKKFKSVKKVKAASTEELVAVIGVAKASLITKFVEQQLNK
jgi:excinuclease ABC subunit C